MFADLDVVGHRAIEMEFDACGIALFGPAALQAFELELVETTLEGEKFLDDPVAVEYVPGVGQDGFLWRPSANAGDRYEIFSVEEVAGLPQKDAKTAT